MTKKEQVAVSPKQRGFIGVDPLKNPKGRVTALASASCHSRRNAKLTLRMLRNALPIVILFSLYNTFVWDQGSLVNGTHEMASQITAYYHSEWVYEPQKPPLLAFVSSRENNTGGHVGMIQSSEYNHRPVSLIKTNHGIQAADGTPGFSTASGLIDKNSINSCGLDIRCNLPFEGEYWVNKSELIDALPMGHQYSLNLLRHSAFNLDNEKSNVSAFRLDQDIRSISDYWVFLLSLCFLIALGLMQFLSMKNRYRLPY